MGGRKLQRIVAVGLVPVAVAGAGALIALRLHYQPPRVPEYAVTRGENERALVPGAHFHIELRPAARVDGAIGARAFLLRGDVVRPWDPPFDVTRDGIVTIDGPVDDLFRGIPAGPWEVAVAVGRPEVLPTAPRDVLRERGRDGGVDAAWRLAVARVRLEGMP
ncbi:MAG: hypothetical protein FWD17_07720 [Polyangiaceae bacterium]|nr:hypothetical protein [Polyangiaceae bacterium]